MRRATLAATVLLVLTTLPAEAAKDRAPGFYEQTLDLPGMPAAMIPADMNGDGRKDLVVLVAYTGWGEVATTEQVRFDDIEGLVEVMSVVSSLVDRRELRVYPARADGLGYEAHLPALELDTSVHALDTSAAGDRLLAITDEGIAVVRSRQSGGEASLELVPLLEATTSLAGTGSFYSEFRFLHDLDGDGREDLILPSEEGWTVHRGLSNGFETSPTATLTVPPRPTSYWDEGDEREEDHEREEAEADETGEERAGRPVEEPNPPDEETEEPATEEPATEGRDKEVRVETRKRSERPRKPQQPALDDVDSDGRTDLIVFKPDRGRDPLVYVNRGGLDFAPSVEINLGKDRDNEEIVYIGDLDGDGRNSVVAAEELEPGDEAGFKMEIEHAKEPDFIYRVYPLAADLSVADRPVETFQAEGYTFEGEEEEEDEDDIEVKLPGGFQDLDGDGRQDLVAITLDFSLVPLIFRALVLGSISLRMDFHPYCQDADGGLLAVPDLDLSGKFKINLRNVQVKHLSQFEGDFNGDGRADFIQLGRGKKVTIHQGGPGCTYPVEPDRRIRLAREPKHLGLVRIVDLDENGRSDLYVVHPEKDPKSGESAPVRVDLYLGEEPQQPVRTRSP